MVKRPDVAFLVIAFVYGILGMIFGVRIGIENESYPMSIVHAHMNLVGWVAMAIYGLFYRAYPATAATHLATAHFWTANAGAVLLIAGMYAVYEYEDETAAIIGSLLTVLSLVLFLINFLRAKDG